MTTADSRKILLFDIGGVVVCSPLAAILSYERAHSIPPGYINHAIARSSHHPHGAWARLERGEILLDDAFFAAFKRDIEDAGAWRDFLQKRRGVDPPPAAEGGTGPGTRPEVDARALFWQMMRHARAPDPHVFPALLRLRASGRAVLGALSNTVAFPPGVRDERGDVFDPRLRAGPGGRVLEGGRTDVRGLFDCFVASAEAGVRKPERRAFEVALGELGRVMGRAVRPREVLFVDDIGSNLKAAREMGFETLRVVLGESGRAVEELERWTGVRLVDGGKGEGVARDLKARM